MKSKTLYIFFIGIVFFSILLDTKFFEYKNLNKTEKNKSKILNIPPLLEYNESNKEKIYNLIIQKGETEIIDGIKTETYGYNGSMLGPTIKMRKNENYRFKIYNKLGEKTSVHWHGLKVDGEMDGGPHQNFINGTYWEPNFQITQPASTLWYHPHTLYKSGEQAYKGLGGFIIIEDENSDKLDIPKEYGIDDIPLVIQDKSLTRDGKLVYSNSHMTAMFGMRGNTVLVNGQILPEFKVQKKYIRFRLLNGSNATNYNYSFNDNREFYQIATDGGFLEKKNKINKLFLSPGERAEIIVEFTKEDKQNSNLRLLADDNEILKLNVQNLEKNIQELPEILSEIEHENIGDAKISRKFILNDPYGPMYNINGERMDMNKINEFSKQNQTEIWEVTNSDQHHGIKNQSPSYNGTKSVNGHPFHIHSVQFLVLERNGKSPDPSEKGWKDTIFLEKNETVKLLIKFQNKGVFMYHCHILEHEDNGMMGQIKIE